ncbi:MAG: response regulator [Eubacterium sp.]|nr:response regulator [Eubacterium sp.]
MKEKKGKGLYEISIGAVKLLLFFVLIFNAFIFVYYGLINKSDPIESEPVQFVGNWEVSYGENGDQTIKATLPKNIKGREYLYFDTRRDAIVYINGQFRKDFISERDINVPGGSFKRFLFSVPLEEGDSGCQIVIERKSVLDFDKDIPEVFISTRSGAMNYLLKTSGVSFVLAFIVLIFSFVSFVVSIVLRIIMKQRIDMMYGALGIFSIAAWLITDSFLFPFVFGVNHVNGLLSFMFCLIIPLGLAIYLFSIQRGRYKKFKIVTLIISILNVLVWPILHFTGILPFYNVLNEANAVLVILSVAGIAILIIDALRGNTVSYHYTFIGFLGFLVGCLIELINVIFEFAFMKDTILMVVGLAFLLTFIVVQQVHDLRKINMEKQHAIDISEAKTKFLASMSHEIRTPINSILGMNEMILRENDDKTIEEYSKTIKSSGKMLLMLVNDVLDFTKIEAGKLEINNTDFLMSDMLYDVISLIKERAEEKDLRLDTIIGEDVPDQIFSDEFRIRQILINFLNNAVKYTEKGQIILKVDGEYTEDGYTLKLAVKDTGKGIPEEDQEGLFEAFSRADIKSNASIEGTGLGLAIVKSIVASMNGELGVESQYGIGSEFWVKLPVTYKNKTALGKDFMDKRISKAEYADTCSFIAPDARILAVDDNQSNLTIVKLFLKKNKIVPDLCSTGKSAIEFCKRNKYDLILMDHMMPEPDGIESLHIIRKEPDSLNKDTKAIVLTANAVAGSRQLYIDEGFDDYLTKPLDSKVLEEVVKNMLPKTKVIEGEEMLKLLEKEADTKASANSSSRSPGKASAQSYSPIDSNTGEKAYDKAGQIDSISGGQVYDKNKSIKDRLSSIEGLDYSTALTHCGGDEELLEEILGDLVKECQDRVDRMRKSLEEKDIKAYQIDSHSIKSSMATIGLKDFSQRAKEHEFAAKDMNTDFIYANADSFINDYIDICNMLGKVIKVSD